MDKEELKQYREDYQKWTHVSQTGKLPSGKQYAILENTSVYIPGDERSRTNPGHGYPGGSEYHVTLKVTNDEDVWKREITKLSTPTGYSRKDFKAFVINPVEITVGVSVEVKP